MIPEKHLYIDGLIICISKVKSMIGKAFHIAAYKVEIVLFIGR